MAVMRGGCLIEMVECMELKVELVGCNNEVTANEVPLYYTKVNSGVWFGSCVYVSPFMAASWCPWQCSFLDQCLSAPSKQTFN